MPMYFTYGDAQQLVLLQHLNQFLLNIIQDTSVNLRYRHRLRFQGGGPTVNDLMVRCMHYDPPTFRLMLQGNVETLSRICYVFGSADYTGRMPSKIPNSARVAFTAVYGGGLKDEIHHSTPITIDFEIRFLERTLSLFTRAPAEDMCLPLSLWHQLIQAEIEQLEQSQKLLRPSYKLSSELAIRYPDQHPDQLPTILKSPPGEKL